jgi:multidrug efflux pump subunit AcrB
MREERENGETIVEAAILAAKTGFRPISMTSFALIPGANSGKSICIAVASFMING